MAALLLYLIGARAAGKTAVFDALVQTPEGPHFATKGGHRLGTVKVPDARLAVLRDLFQPKKYIPAEVTFVDVAMPANAEGSGFSQLNAFLGEADAFALVVQSFGETDGAVACGLRVRGSGRRGSDGGHAVRTRQRPSGSLGDGATPWWHCDRPGRSSPPGRHRVGRRYHHQHSHR